MNQRDTSTSKKINFFRIQNIHLRKFISLKKGRRGIRGKSAIQRVSIYSRLQIQSRPIGFEKKRKFGEAQVRRRVDSWRWVVFPTCSTTCCRWCRFNQHWRSISGRARRLCFISFGSFRRGGGWKMSWQILTTAWWQKWRRNPRRSHLRPFLVLDRWTQGPVFSTPW